MRAVAPPLMDTGVGLTKVPSEPRAEASFEVAMAGIHLREIGVHTSSWFPFFDPQMTSREPSDICILYEGR